ncbi:isochorismatase family protein [Streptomyces sp. BP-8]|uniref:Isochorismatase family protein n=1 Tax=Streptomyces sirii TaxID=3127701 RepID=A0ABZ2QYR6_9ACTN
MTTTSTTTGTHAGTDTRPGIGSETQPGGTGPEAHAVAATGAPIHSAGPLPPVDALLLIDLQSAFVAGDEAVPEAARVLDRSRDLLAGARAAGALVVHLQNDGEPGTVDEPHTPGWELHLPVEPGPREVVVRKTEDDGFEGTELGTLLADADVQALAVCGVLSEMCVAATARTALDRDFRVVLPHDAHATYDIPAAPGISDVVPAAMSSRAAEWALGDEVEIVAHSADVTFARTTSTASHPDR